MTHQATKRNGEEARDSMIRVLPAAGGGSAGSNLAGAPCLTGQYHCAYAIFALIYRGGIHLLLSTAGVTA